MCYHKTEVTVTVSVPENLPVCSCCRWCCYEHDLRRYTCLITNEPMLEINKGIGQFCPLRREENSE